MILADRWDGSASPFQGDRTLRLLLLPERARVLRARVRVEPVGAPGGEPFVERLAVDPAAPPGLGAAQVRHAASGGQGAATEVDLRGRRTLAAVEGEGLGQAMLFADLGGGVFVPVTAAGGIGTGADGAVQLVDGGGVAALPGIAATRLRLVGGASAPEVAAVRVRSVPSGVTLRLGDGPPFWVHPGEMPGAGQTPDFTALLAAWVDAHGRAAGGYVAVPLTLHTETPGRFVVSVELEVVVQAALAPEAPEATFPFDASTGTIRPPGTPPYGGDLSVRLPAGARAVPGETRLRLRGAFGDTRVVPWRGPTGVVDPAQARGRVRISAGYAQAQEIPPGAESLIAALDLLLLPVDRAPELQLDLRADEGGRPAQGTLLPRPLRVKVMQGAAADRPVWVTAALPEPFHVDEGRRYWLVAQAVDGDADWVAYPHDAPAARALVLTGAPAAPPPPLPALQSSADGGMSWRSAGALVALCRLRARPPRYTTPLRLEAGVPPSTIGEAEAGEKRAVRVPLDRFDPLGRVDFTLDDAALADAVTAAAVRHGQACPPGEALRDGGFSAWVTEGGGMGAAVPVDLADARALRVAAAPDGRWAYVLASRGGRLLLLRVDVPADVVVNEVALAGSVPARPASCALLVHPDGSRAYVLTQPPLPARGLRVEVVNLDTAAVLGRPRELGEAALPLPAVSVTVPAALAAVLSPDGDTLYVAAGGAVAVLDLPALEAGGAAPEMAGLLRLRQPLEGTARCIALAAGGERLCVGSGTAPTAGVLHLLDPASFDPAAPQPLAGETMPLPGAPAAVALTPDGALAVVAYRGRSGVETGVALVDLQRAAVLSLRAKQPVDAFDVAMAADGARAYVAVRGGVATVEIARRVLLSSSIPGTDGDLLDLALTPQGDRVFAVFVPRATKGPMELRAVQVGTRRLSRWTAGGPVAIGAPRGDGPRGVVLGTADAPKPDPAMLSQVVPARAGCRYLFSFQGLAQPGSSAVAELFWRGSRGEPLDPDTLPLAESARFAQPGPDGRALRAHRRLVSPPAGTASVEVRFRVPTGAAEVAAASLASTAERVVNGDFRLPLRGADGGWNAEPAGKAVVRAEPAGVRVRAAGPGDAELRQEVDASGGAPLSLRFIARGEPAPDGRAPALRVAWTGEDGRTLGAPVELPVLADDFPRHALRLDPPPGAARALLSLAVPPRATLYAETLTIVAVPEVDVPLRFIADCPGELTVTGARVVYDFAGDDVARAGSTSADGRSANGGAASGAAGGVGGAEEDGGDDGGCDGCGPDGGASSPASPGGGATSSTVARAQPRTVSLATVRPAPGARWMRPGTVSGIVAEAAQPVAAAGGIVASTQDAAVSSGTPVIVVKGVGDVRQARLAAIGIDSAEKLAAATQDQLLAADPSLFPATAADLIASAADAVRQAREA